MADDRKSAGSARIGRFITFVVSLLAE